MTAQKSENLYINGGFFERVAASIIDTIVLLLLIVPVYIAIIVVSTLGYPFAQNPFFLSGVTGLITILYNIILLSLFGQTLGKKALSLKVINQSGNKLAFVEALIRESIGKWVSYYILGLGYLWILIDPNRRAWHDKIAKTQVVKVDDRGNYVKGVNPPVTTFSKITFIFLGFIIAVYIFIQICILFFLFVAQPYTVKGSTMEPTLRNNQNILANKFEYQMASPKRGDIIVFTPPQKGDIVYIKRIIAIPGDRLQILNGKVYINGKVAVEPYLAPNTTTTIFPGQKSQEGQTITIPSDNYFVLGDNREHSSDSREFGPIPKASIIGKFWFRYL